MKKLTVIKNLFLLALLTSAYCCNESEDMLLNEIKNNQDPFEVSIDDVNHIANNFTSEKYTIDFLKIRKKSDLSSSKGVEGFKIKKIKNIKTIKENNKQLLHIINYDEGGFIILSGDKRSIPILAHSLTNNFDLDIEDTPSGVLKWLAFAKSQINEIKTKGFGSYKHIDQKWDDIISGKIGEINLSKYSSKDEEPDPNDCEDEIIITVSPILKTTWDQGYGFYESLPNCSPTSSLKSFTGCLPLAMAQIMKANEHPTTYSWSNMANTYGTSTTQDFILDIFNSFDSRSELDYDCDGTSVDNDYDFSDIFKTDYGYTSANWSNSYNYLTVKNDLLNGKPVILIGTDTSQNNYAHAWVADGVRERGYCIFDSNGNWISTVYYMDFHCNWGWGGNANGYFAINNFSPTFSFGSTSISYDFNSNMKMAYNITP